MSEQPITDAERIRQLEAHIWELEHVALPGYRAIIEHLEQRIQRLEETSLDGRVQWLEAAVKNHEVFIDRVIDDLARDNKTAERVTAEIKEHQTEIAKETQSILAAVAEEWRKQAQRQLDAQLERMQNASRTAKDWLQVYAERKQTMPELTLPVFADEVGVNYEALKKAQQRQSPQPSKRRGRPAERGKPSK